MSESGNSSKEESKSKSEGNSFKGSKTPSNEEKDSEEK